MPPAAAPELSVSYMLMRDDDELWFGGGCEVGGEQKLPNGDPPVVDEGASR